MAIGSDISCRDKMLFGCKDWGGGFAQQDLSTDSQGTLSEHPNKKKSEIKGGGRATHHI